MRIYVMGNDSNPERFEKNLRRFGELVIEGNRTRPKEQEVVLVLGTDGEILTILADTGAPCIVLHIGPDTKDYARPNVQSMPCESEGDRLNRILQCDAFCFYPGLGQIAAELVWIASTILEKEAFPIEDGISSMRPRRLALANGRSALGGDWPPPAVRGFLELTGAWESSWSWWLENCPTAEQVYSFLTTPAPVNPTRT